MSVSANVVERATPEEGVVAAAPPNARRWLPPALSAVLSTFVLVRSSITIGGVRYWPLVDDAMISMRYARNLADGHGLVWNAGGDHVEGYTNFGWTLLMGLFHAVGLP